jgi:hypothetical protein
MLAGAEAVAGADIIADLDLDRGELLGRPWRRRRRGVGAAFAACRAGRGPAGITLSAQQLHGLFGTSSCRVLLEYRAAGAAARVDSPPC